MQLHFKELGRGEPWLILRGLFGSGDNFRSVAPKFGEHFRVILLDLRNHGQSPHSAGMDYLLMASDIEEFLRAHELPGACIMGHSLGGKVAMQFALQYPERVRKLVLVDMAPREYQPAHEAILAAMLVLDLKSFQTRHQVEEILAAAIPSQAVRRFLLKNLGRNACGALVWKMNLRGIVENYSKLGSALSAAKSCAQPVLFVRGGRSDFIRDEDWPLIQSLFPRAGLQTIPTARHWVHSDAPDEFTRRVLQFLGQPGATA